MPIFSSKNLIFLTTLLLLGCSKQPQHYIEQYQNINVTFVGDSITYGVRTKKTYVEYLKEEINFKTVTVSAVAGSCVSKHSDYEMKYKPLTTRLDEISLSSDLVVLFMGTNDYKHDSPLGDITDSEDISFLGALNYTFETVKNNIPNAKLMYITPLQRSDYVAPNTYGLLLEDYVSAIKESCNKYNVSVFDAYNLVDVSEHLADKLHPDKKGHEILAHALLEYFNQTPLF